MNDIFVYEKRRKKIGERIKRMRKGRKLTQGQLAGLITDYVQTDKEKGFGQSTISEWERGNQLPPLPKLIALSEIFQCDISYILCDYDKENKDVSDISEITGLSINAAKTIVDIKRARGTAGLDILSQLIINPVFWNAIANLNYARFATDNAQKPMSDALQTKLLELKMMNLIERHPGASIPSPEQMKDINLYHAAQKFSECAAQIVNRNQNKEEVKNG